MAEPAANNDSGPPDRVAWVQRVNARWITHGGLGGNAAAYLEHLAQTDAARLACACRLAYLMVQHRDPVEDPKPWFYSGLFGFATPEEARRYLAGHWLVATTVAPADFPPATHRKLMMRYGVPAVAPTDFPLATHPSPNSVSPATWDKIQQLRAALTRLRVDARSPS